MRIYIAWIMGCCLLLVPSLQAEYEGKVSEYDSVRIVKASLFNNGIAAVRCSAPFQKVECLFDRQGRFTDEIDHLQTCGG